MIKICLLSKVTPFTKVPALCVCTYSMLIALNGLNCPPGMLNPVLNQIKIIILYLYTLHAILSFVAA